MKDGSEGLALFIWIAMAIFAPLAWHWSMETWIQEEAREVIRQERNRE